MKQSNTKLSQYTSLFLALVVSALIGVYPHLRYGGFVSGGGDAQRFAEWITAVQKAMSIVPNANTYPHGYGYQVLALLFDQLSGTNLGQFQIYLGTLLIVWTVSLAWLCYREITQSHVGASIGTFVLLIQPEVLFALLRGTHEKFTRGLMFLSLYLLLRSISSRGQWRRFAAFLISFYLSMYALIAFNNLLATSFITALTLSLGLSLFIVRQPTDTQAGNNAVTNQRLFYATIIALILAFLFTFYAYPPARQSILTVESIFDRLAMLFLDVEEAAVNPYQTISNTWISLPVYLIISIANWLLLVVSFVLWALQTITWWRTQWPTESHILLLWSLYGAFGFLGAFSIAVDISGAIAGNLQHRIFPSFAMIAAALVADWFVRMQAQHRLKRRLTHVALAGALAFFSIVAVVKATIEPSLSNKWTFYTPAEFKTVSWVRNTDLETATWTSFDERLRAAIGICCGWESEGLLLDSWDPDPGTRNFLVSDIIRARAQRMGVPLPIEGDSLRVYDNGSAGLYHLRPVTPFQR